MTKPIIAKATENSNIDLPVKRLLSIKMILYRKRNANTTQMMEIFPRIRNLYRRILREAINVQH